MNHLLELFEIVPLKIGEHSSFADGACALELVSYIAREPWSDHPACVCPVLGAFFRDWNDGLPDYERNTILRPFLPRLIGTNGSNTLAERRSLMAADWLVRVHTPAWLRLAKLDAQADALTALPEITSMASIKAIRGQLEAARTDANATWDACDSTWAATGAATGATTWAAVWDSTAAAAKAASGAAAKAASGAALKPTRDLLIKSAAELVERMILAEVA